MLLAEGGCASAACFLLHLDAVEALAEDTVHVAFGEECMLVDGLHQPEDGDGFLPLGQDAEHFDRALAVPSLAVEHGDAAVQPDGDYVGDFGVFLRENEELHRLLVAVRHADDPEPIIAEGRWYGEVADTPQGEGGFGYDPYFYLPQYGKTAAQLTADEKNAVSHRGVALKKLVEEMKTRWML